MPLSASLLVRAFHLVGNPTPCSEEQKGTTVSKCLRHSTCSRSPVTIPGILSVAAESVCTCFELRFPRSPDRTDGRVTNTLSFKTKALPSRTKALSFITTGTPLYTKGTLFRHNDIGYLLERDPYLLQQNYNEGITLYMKDTLSRNEGLNPRTSRNEGIISNTSTV